MGDENGEGKNLGDGLTDCASKITQKSHITNHTHLCAVLCAILRMFYSQKRTERTNRTSSHNANRTTMPRARSDSGCGTKQNLM